MVILIVLKAFPDGYDEVLGGEWLLEHRAQPPYFVWD
jgi:hypothetical protein